MFLQEMLTEGFFEDATIIPLWIPKTKANKHFRSVLSQ